MLCVSFFFFNILFINEFICVFVLYYLEAHFLFSASVTVATVFSKLTKIKMESFVCSAVTNYFRRKGNYFHG